MCYGKMLKVFNFLMYQTSIKHLLHTIHILGWCEEYKDKYLTKKKIHVTKHHESRKG